MSFVHPVFVIKVGGSLFDWSELPEQIDSFLTWVRSRLDANQPQVLLVPGGGQFVDSISYFQDVHRFSDLRAHHLAIEAMNLSASLLQRILPHSSLISDFEELEEVWTEGDIPILEPASWLENSPEDAECLPQDWSSSSDSIAALVAIALEADALILLKSRPWSDQLGWEEAANQGVVDSFFPSLAKNLPQILYFNLRESPHSNE